MLPLMAILLTLMMTAGALPPDRWGWAPAVAGSPRRERTFELSSSPEPQSSQAPVRRQYYTASRPGAVYPAYSSGGFHVPPLSAGFLASGWRAAEWEAVAAAAASPGVAAYHEPGDEYLEQGSDDVPVYATPFELLLAAPAEPELYETVIYEQPERRSRRRPPRRLHRRRPPPHRSPVVLRITKRRIIRD